MPEPGDVVFVRFPFSDLPQFKRRPDLVLAGPDDGGDCEVLKISSRRLKATGRLQLEPEIFQWERCHFASSVVVDHLARIHESAFEQIVGKVTAALSATWG